MVLPQGAPCWTHVDWSFIQSFPRGFHGRFICNPGPVSKSVVPEQQRCYTEINFCGWQHRLIICNKRTSFVNVYAIVAKWYLWCLCKINKDVGIRVCRCTCMYTIYPSLYREIEYNTTYKSELSGGRKVHLCIQTSLHIPFTVATTIVALMVVARCFWDPFLYEMPSFGLEWGYMGGRCANGYVTTSSDMYIQ